ncbi:MAG: glycosyltransferase family 2 protein [Deltaproteobacteria bacterium]|nr:glycosyltransferase family 2 protein [Deltaproteobacteria bacterium]
MSEVEREQSTPAISVVLPVFDERPNLEALLAELGDALAALGRSYEIVLVDDGSRDGSREYLEARAQAEPTLKLVIFARNQGQAAALDAGLAHTSGEIVVTLDADGQNDPADIGPMIALLEQGYDLVTGWRRDRKDRLLSRRLPSRAANALICGTLRLPIHDLGCTLRVYRGEVARRLHLQPGLHRFIVPLASAGGARIAEVEVHHRERLAGQTKYGIGRVFPVLRDFYRVGRMTLDPGRLPVRPEPPPWEIARLVGF